MKLITIEYRYTDRTSGISKESTKIIYALSSNLKEAIESFNRNYIECDMILAKESNLLEFRLGEITNEGAADLYIVELTGETEAAIYTDNISSEVCKLPNAIGFSVFDYKNKVIRL